MNPFLGILLLCNVCQGSYYRTGPAAPANFAEFTRLAGLRFGFGLGRSGRSLLQSEPLSAWECENVTGVPLHVRNGYPLSPFYKKYVHAYGIPVISSENATDAALRRACYVVVFLLADREDIRRSVYKHRGRAGVISVTEGVTSIPEHSWLDDWWNGRARGLGGTLSMPISTCGEENILCLRGDWYPRQDIFLHEFVHGLHNLGVVFSIPGFDDRLRKRFKYLKGSGELWKGTYAMSTDREYIAEGAMSFFDCNTESDPPNGIHNHVNTRTELKSYDPVLYGFLKEIFPCQNKLLQRCDAVAGAKPYNFKMNCDSNGNGVWMDFQTKRPVGTKPTSSPNTPTRPSNTPPPPSPPVKGRDDHKWCSYWAGVGYCKKYYSYMSVNCRKSCKLCGK